MRECFSSPQIHESKAQYELARYRGAAPYRLQYQLARYHDAAPYRLQCQLALYRDAAPYRLQCQLARYRDAAHSSAMSVRTRWTHFRSRSKTSL